MLAPSSSHHVSGTTTISASKSFITRATSKRTPRSGPKRPRPQCALNAATLNSIKSSSAAHRRERLNPDALGQEFPVIRGVAQVDLGRLRALEVEVGRVLPREADA